MKKALLALMLCLALLPAALAQPLQDVDLELSDLPASMAYAQLVAMLRDPEAYANQWVRLSGVFNYSQARERGVVIVADTSGCCEAGLDLCCEAGLTFPDDYPELYSKIRVTGFLESDEDGTCRLVDAVLEPR